MSKRRSLVYAEINEKGVTGFKTADGLDASSKDLSGYVTEGELNEVLEDYVKKEDEVDTPISKGTGIDSAKLKVEDQTKEDSASGNYSTALGIENDVTSEAGFVAGKKNTVYGEAAHAEGTADYTLDYIYTKHGETYDGNNDHIIENWDVEGDHFSLAKGTASHVEGINSLALGDFSHAEGNCTVASGKAAHTEGHNTSAGGHYSHAGGEYSSADHNVGFVHGSHLRTGKDAQAVFGAYNSQDAIADIVVGHGSDGNPANSFCAGYGRYEGNVDDFFIKVGNTVITETQLNALLALLQQ